MNKLLPLLAAALLCGCGDSNQPAPGPEVDLSSMLQALTNVNELAQTPVGDMALHSTYDITGGNTDYATWEPRHVGEDGLVTVAELEGPGCMVRLWKVSVAAKNWCFFFDGETEPRIKLPPTELFGGVPPFTPPLSDRVSSGFYTYFPLPYEKSLRIAVEPTNMSPLSRRYYQVAYRTFPPGTKVTSYPKNLSAAEQGVVDQVNASWSNQAGILKQAAADCGEAATIDIAPGASGTILDLNRGGTLRAFTVKVIPKSKGLLSELAADRLLRELVLEIHWDGAELPSVQAPLGSFFANGLYHRPYASMVTGYQDGSYICRFPMPFTSSAKGVIRNDSKIPIAIETAHHVDHAELTRPNYFHARWKSAVGEGIPFRILREGGEGYYVGCYLNAIGMDGSWNILEGDESLKINKEITPSWHGTGLEDYFNGAWYYKGIFDLPLHGLLEKAPIRTAQYRIHLHDRVSFNNGLVFNFEFGHGNTARGYLSGTTYYYKPELPTREFPLPPAAARFPPRDPLYELGFMGGLFELEREELFEEAAARCRRFAVEQATSTYAQTFLLRDAAYRERTQGIEPARKQYEMMAKRPAGDLAGDQAKNLLWLHEDPANHLVGLNPNGASTVYINGELLGKGDQADTLTVLRKTLPPGEYEITAHIKPTRGDPWFSMFLKSAKHKFITDKTWECSAVKPKDWPKTGDPDVKWLAVSPPGAGEMLARESYWKNTPNAYVDVQSAQQLLRPWKSFEANQKMVPAYLRAKITIPPAAE